MNAVEETIPQLATPHSSKSEFLQLWVPSPGTQQNGPCMALEICRLGLRRLQSEESHYVRSHSGHRDVMFYVVSTGRECQSQEWSMYSLGGGPWSPGRSLRICGYQYLVRGSLFPVHFHPSAPTPLAFLVAMTTKLRHHGHAMAMEKESLKCRGLG